MDHGRRCGRCAGSSLLLGAFALGLALVLTSCQSKVPRTLVANTTVDGNDTAPGDGVCEITQGLGNCSLRAAITEANAQPLWITTVDLPSATYALTLAGDEDSNGTGDLDVKPGSGTMTIAARAGGASIVAAGVEGGIDLISGSLTVTGLGVRHAEGAGIRTRGSTTLSIRQSSSTENGGDGLVVAAGSTVGIENSTLSSNQGSGISNAGTVTATFGTITENGAGGVGGGGSTTSKAGIIARQGSGADCSSTVTSLGFNLDSDGSCQLSANGDRSNTDPMLGPPIPSPNVVAHKPRPGSPAIDRVSTIDCSSLGTVDQTGASRPFGSACDRGAIEASFALELTVDTATDAPDATPGDGRCDIGDGTCSLRAAVDETNTNVPTAGHTITLVTDVLLSRSGSDDTNQRGDLDVRSTVTIRGNGRTLDANSVDRALHHISATLSVDQLKITRGRLTSASAMGGGIYNAAGALSVVNSSVVDGTLTGTNAKGAGIAVAGGNVTIRSSTISGNAATAWGTAGGGISVVAGTLDMSNSTVAGNTAASGAAISQQTGTTSIVASTFAQNSSTTIKKTSGSLAIAASIISSPMNVADCTSPVTSGGWNATTDSSCSLNGPGDRQFANLLLAPLALNGGATATILPAANSVTVDAIPAGVPGLCDASTHGDQRGTPRPVNGSCDMGSVEGSGPALAPLALTVNTDMDASDAAPANGVCDIGNGTCSLRAAIDETNAAPTADTITIATGVNPKLSKAGTDDTNVSGDLDVNGHLHLRGNGGRVDASNLDRAFQHRMGVFELESVTVSGGRSTAGAAVLNTSGDLRVHDATFAGNQVVPGPDGGNGSAISVASGAATIERSTLSGNSGTGSGGALAVVGGDVMVRSSTIAGNSSSDRAAGAVYQQAGTVVVTRSTIAANSAKYAIRRTGGAFHVSATVLHTTTGSLCLTTVSSSGWNVASDATCGLAAISDLQPADPLLAALAGNGGITQTMLPASNGPGVDRIPSGTPDLCDASTTTDQRGQPRPDGTACDVGAVEGSGPAQLPLHLIVDTSDDAVDALPGDGVCDVGNGTCSLRAAVEESNRSPGADDITITTGTNPTLARAGSDDTNSAGDLDISGFLAIHGNGATLSGNGADRVLHHFSGHLSLDHLTITGGRAQSIGPRLARGGGIWSTSGDLTLTSVDVRGNSGHESGGGIDAAYGVTTLIDSSVRQNQLTGGSGLSGGGIYLVSGTLRVTRSSIGG